MRVEAQPVRSRNHFQNASIMKSMHTLLFGFARRKGSHLGARDLNRHDCRLKGLFVWGGEFDEDD